MYSLLSCCYFSSHWCKWFCVFCVLCFVFAFEHRLSIFQMTVHWYFIGRMWIAFHCFPVIPGSDYHSTLWNELPLYTDSLTSRFLFRLFSWPPSRYKLCSSSPFLFMHMHVRSFVMCVCVWCLCMCGCVCVSPYLPLLHSLTHPLTHSLTHSFFFSPSLSSLCVCVCVSVCVCERERMGGCALCHWCSTVVSGLFFTSCFPPDSLGFLLVRWAGTDAFYFSHLKEQYMIYQRRVTMCLQLLMIPRYIQQR